MKDERTRKAALLLLALLLFVSSEAVLRIAGAGKTGDPDLVVVNPAAFFQTKRVNGNMVFAPGNDHAYAEGHPFYPVKKPPHTLRLFALGGSASGGWPHGPAQSYPSYLKRLLARALPQREIEIINAGAHAYASYRLRIIFDDIFRFDPDVIVVYTGHNEFLEKRAYSNASPAVTRLLKIAGYSRLFTTLRARYRALQKGSASLNEDLRPRFEESIVDKAQRTALALRTDPAAYEDVVNHFRRTLAYMSERAEERGVPLILVAPPSNIKDWEPNASTDASLPDSADALFSQAKELDGLGRTEEARALYQQAKDADLNPFRATSRLINAVREIAASHRRTYLADAETAFQKAASGPAPGFDLFVDYVHPTPRANALIARTVFNSVAEALSFTPVESGESELPFSEDEPEIDFTLFWLYAMMHQYDAVIRRADVILKRLSRNPALYERISTRPKILPPRPVDFVKNTREIFQDTAEIRRRERTKKPVSAKRKADVLKRFQDFYKSEFNTSPYPKGWLKVQ